MRGVGCAKQESNLECVDAPVRRREQWRYVHVPMFECLCDAVCRPVMTLGNLSDQITVVSAQVVMLEQLQTLPRSGNFPGQLRQISSLLCMQIAKYMKQCQA